MSTLLLLLSRCIDCRVPPLPWWKFCTHRINNQIPRTMKAGIANSWSNLQRCLYKNTFKLVRLRIQVLLCVNKYQLQTHRAYDNYIFWWSTYLWLSNLFWENIMSQLLMSLHHPREVVTSTLPPAKSQQLKHNARFKFIDQRKCISLEDSPFQPAFSPACHKTNSHGRQRNHISRI